MDHPPPARASRRLPAPPSSTAGWAGEGRTDWRQLRGGAGILNQTGHKLTGHKLTGHKLADAIRGLRCPCPPTRCDRADRPPLAGA